MDHDEMQAEIDRLHLALIDTRRIHAAQGCENCELAMRDEADRQWRMEGAPGA